MKGKLLSNCKTNKDKDDQRAYFLEHKRIFDALKEILEKDLQLVKKERSSTKRYDDQSWAYKQADYNGCERTYEEILNLLTIGE